MATNNNLNNQTGNADFTVNQSTAATTGSASVVHSDNTSATSNARLRSEVGGASGGDPYAEFIINGVRNYAIGIDNSSSDTLKINTNTIPVDPSSGTNLWSMTSSGQVTAPLQPSFLAILTADQLNVTGAGAAYTVIADTEVYDNGANYNNATGVFTAPATGRYLFAGTIRLLQLAAGHSTGTVTVITSNRTYLVCNDGPNGTRDATNALTYSFSIIADMDATDTATMVVTISNGTATVDVDGSVVTAPATWFSGELLG